jgi:hypothetical protein
MVNRDLFWKIGICLLFVLAIGVRLQNLDQPLVEIMETRQIQTADISRNLERHSFNVFMPQVDRFGSEAPYLVLEFPFLNLAASVSSLLTGGQIEIFGRLWSIIFWALGAGVLYLYLKRHFPLKAVFLGMCFYFFAFSGIMASRSFQPESLVLFFYIWILYELDTIYRSQSLDKRWLRLAVLVGIVCLAKAPMAIILIFPLLAILYQGYRNQEVDLKKVGYCLTVCFLPVLLWTLQGRYVHAQFPNEITTNYQISNWFKPQYFFSTEDFNYYLNMLMQFRYSFLTAGSALLDILASLVLFISIAVLITDNKMKRFFAPVLLSLFCYFILFNNHTATHYYYHLPLLPIFAVSLAALASKLDRMYLLTCILIVTTVSLVTISTVGAYVKDSPYGQKLLDCADTIKKVVPERSLLVTSMEDEISLQYYSDRIGWPFVVNRKAHKQRFRDSAFITSFELDHRKAFEKFLTKGANYYANCDFKNLNNYPLFIDFLSSRFEKVHHEPGKLVIFKLQ